MDTGDLIAHNITSSVPLHDSSSDHPNLIHDFEIQSQWHWDKTVQHIVETYLEFPR